MAGSYNQFLHDFTARDSVGVFDQNASPNYQDLGANGLNCLGTYQSGGWATIDLGDYKDGGSLQSTVGADGRQQRGTQMATASFAEGQTQDLTLSDAFGAGVHDVAVSFVDDAWGDAPSTGRNLHVNSIYDDGKHYASATAIPMANRTVHFQVGAANANAT